MVDRQVLEAGSYFSKPTRLKVEAVYPGEGRRGARAAMIRKELTTARTAK